MPMAVSHATAQNLVYPPCPRPSRGICTPPANNDPPKNMPRENLAKMHRKIYQKNKGLGSSVCDDFCSGTSRAKFTALITRSTAYTK